MQLLVLLYILSYHYNSPLRVLITPVPRIVSAIVSPSLRLIVVCRPSFPVSSRWVGSHRNYFYWPRRMPPSSMFQFLILSTSPPAPFFSSAFSLSSLSHNPLHVGCNPCTKNRCTLSGHNFSSFPVYGRTRRHPLVPVAPFDPRRFRTARRHRLRAAVPLDRQRCPIVVALSWPPLRRHSPTHTKIIAPRRLRLPGRGQSPQGRSLPAAILALRSAATHSSKKELCRAPIICRALTRLQSPLRDPRARDSSLQRADQYPTLGRRSLLGRPRRRRDAIKRRCSGSGWKSAGRCGGRW